MLFNAFQASALRVLMSRSEELTHEPRYLKSSTSSSPQLLLLGLNRNLKFWGLVREGVILETEVIVCLLICLFTTRGFYNEN